MANSFKADISTIEKIIEYYKYLQVETSNINVYFKASCKQFSVTIYSNNTVLFQGKEADTELKRWTVLEYEQPTLDLEYEEIIDDEVDHIGSDEVGCGDYFGPVVVTSCYVSKENYHYLVDIGVKDSKKLTDEKVKELAKLIKDKVQSVTFILTNKKYNEIHNNSAYNLNKIKAYLHNFVLYKLRNKINFDGKIVVDQFCEENTYFNYLKDYKTKDIQTGITFTTKAESKYIAVACASIIARDTFLNEIEKIKEETGYNILLGANSEVDKLAKKILDEKGMDYLSNYVKLHFKNTDKIKQM